MRRAFRAGLARGLRVVWPVLSLLLGAMVALGMVVGFLERWPLQDALYFTFVSGLTIGYGDLVPTRLLSRGLAIAIGACGVLVTALLAAVAVKALPVAGDADAEGGRTGTAGGPAREDERSARSGRDSSPRA